ncbi:uncharacterized protein LOC105694636 [Orussus abietinus]|uniref:uncharacterized protein LOC105694636 n=1 Tax=Orussus abietinus TaxID=222816 RepID=UPI00062618A3|nr:uncharacterized protein LOC105694636 [Orussus abietinus]
MARNIQWNCRGLVNKINELHKLTKKPDIICLQETWLKEEKKINIENMDIIRKDRTTQEMGGGVLIGISKKIEIDATITGRIERVGCQIQDDDKEGINIVFMYNPPNNVITEKEWRKILTHLMSNSPDAIVIICGDLNAQSEMWGSTMENQNGKNLEKAISILPIHILNTEETGGKLLRKPNTDETPKSERKPIKWPTTKPWWYQK